MEPLSKPKPSGSHTKEVKEAREAKEKPERVSWTKAEDDTILASVTELGHKWNRIAERLPGRTDHAIRNRFHRLQSILENQQRQQQRTLAPSQPIHVVPGLHSGGPLSVEGSIDSSGGFEAAYGGFDTPNNGRLMGGEPSSVKHDIT